MPHEFTPADPTLWSHTVRARDRFGETYQGRPLISRDSRISGGVYYGIYGGEAIVVDPEKYPDDYKPLFDKVMARSRDVKKGGRFRKDKPGDVNRDYILDAVFDTVKEALPYSRTGVDHILAEIGEEDGGSFVEGTKVELTSFINNGAEVCRHQALLAGLLLERMKDEGHLRGQVSVDRNTQWSPRGEKGGHAWTRYTNSAGEVYILDIAQGFIGRIEDSQGAAHGWNYLRPEEQAQRTAQNIGPMSTQEIVLPPLHEHSI